MTDEEKEKTKAENEDIKTEREKIAEGIAEKISTFKSFYLGAPIWCAMQAAIEDKDFAPCEIPYRQDEKYWVMQPNKG